MTILNELEEIEQVVACKNYKTAYDLIYKLLLQLDKGEKLISEQYYPQQLSMESNQIYTRLAAAAITTIIDPALKISLTAGEQDIYSLGVMRIRLFMAMFCSGFINADHLVALMGRQLKDHEQDNKLPIKNEQQQCIIKMLLLCSFESNLKIDYEYYFKYYPAIASVVYYSALSNAMVLSPFAHEKREQLLDLVEKLPTFEPNLPLLDLAISSWYYCIFSYKPNKFAIKKQINQFITRWLVQQNIHCHATFSINKKKERPSLMIIFETIHHNHTIFRSYARVIAALREKFHVIGVAQSSVDASVQALVDEMIEAPEDIFNLPQLVQRLLSYEPDLIYYPSLGFARWAVVLCNLRLAPIQIMTGGNPASSFSEVMDYFVIDQPFLQANFAKNFSERLVIVPASTFEIIPPQNSQGYHPKIEAQPAAIRIAIPSRADKLSVPFLVTLQKIQQQSQRPVELAFFPNERGLRLDFTKAQLLKYFHSVKVYPRVEYPHYCDFLSQCHLCASSFPFCGTNSTFDALHLGLPIITLQKESDQRLESMNDAVMIQQLNLPAWLVAKSEADYIAVALRLINNDQERVSISEQCITAITSYIDKQKTIDHSHYFADAFYFLWQQHEHIQKTTKKIILFEELCNGSDPLLNKSST